MRRGTVVAIVVSGLLSGCRGKDQGAASNPEKTPGSEASLAKNPAPGEAPTANLDVGPAHPVPRPAVEDASTLRVDSIPGIGTYIVDANRRTLYMSDADVGGQSSCMVPCSYTWHPLKGTVKPTVASPAIDVTRIGIIERADSISQLTYFGFPLYYYEGDVNPHALVGYATINFGSHHYLVSPAGKPITPKG